MVRAPLTQVPIIHIRPSTHYHLHHEFGDSDGAGGGDGLSEWYVERAVKYAELRK